MAARIQSRRNGISPIDEASRDDLATGDVVALLSLDVATTYAWTIVFAPDGSTAAFSGSSTAITPGSFTVDLVGPYLIRLVVDQSLPSQSTQFVRLRALTTPLGLRLISAGERRDGSGIIPVDISPEGWSNDQNFNLQTLEAAISASTAPLDDVLVAGNLTGGTNIIITSGDSIQGQQGAALGGAVSLLGGTPTSGVANGGNIVVRPGSGLGGGSEGYLWVRNAAGTQGVRLSVSAADTIRIDSNAGGGGLVSSLGLILTDPAAGTSVYLDSANGATAPVSAAGRARIRYNNGALQWEQSINGGAYTAFGGGGGGPDTYTAPNEYYVDPALAVDATKRQYPTIDAALAAATTAVVDPVLVRLSEGTAHAWDGADLDTSATTVIYSEGTATIQWALASALSSDGVLTFKHVAHDCTTNSVAATGTITVATVLIAGDNFTIAGSTFTGVAGARTPWFLDFNASLGTVNALATEIAAAINDPANTINPPISAVALGAVVTITSVNKGTAGNSMTLAVSTTPPGGLTVSGATLTGGLNTTVVMGLQTLVMEEVSGGLHIETADQPTTGTTKSWSMTRSDLALSVLGGAVETDEGTLTITESIVSNNLATPLWDHSVGVAVWNLVIDAFSEVRWYRENGAVNPPVFLLGGGGGNLNTKITNSLFRNQAGSDTTTICDGGGGFGGPTWIASRISNGGGGEFGGSTFVFGDLGTQAGLELEGFPTLPTDAPDGTRAHSENFGQLFFKAALAGAYGQWRADGNVAHLQGSFGGGSPVTLTDVFAPFDPLIAFDVATIFNNVTIRVQGSVIVNKTGPGALTTVWSIDAVLALTNVPGGSFVYGGTPTTLYETTAGLFTIALNVVAGVGFEVVVTRTSGGENPNIRADFYLTEGYES